MDLGAIGTLSTGVTGKRKQTQGLHVRHKVVLYNPHAVFFDMPLALLSIGSALDPEKYDVRILDARILADAHDRLVEECADACCLGVTALTGAPLNDAVAATRRVKAVLPDLPVVWGGWHPSLFPDQTLADEASIDITVQGQGEETFGHVLDVLTEGGDLATVHGICFRDGDGRPRKNPPRAMSDQDQLPPVNYDLIDCEAYFAAKGRRQLDYISSTGCFFRCTFCADPFVFKRGWTSISAERVVEEFATLKARYRITDVNFQDETFFTYRKRSVELAQRLIDADLGLTWAATMRADQGARLSVEDFALLKKSGLRRLLIGVESGSQEMMDWLKKDIKIEQVLECAQRCRDLGIAVQFPFIVGFPGETDASVQASFDMIKRLRAMSPNFSTPIFYFKPYPGTGITKRVEEDGFALPQTLDQWTNFDFVGSVGGPWVSPRKFQDVERFKFYSQIAWSAPSLLRRPLQMLARLRCQHDAYGWPLERLLLGWVRRKAELT